MSWPFPSRVAFYYDADEYDAAPTDAMLLEYSSVVEVAECGPSLTPPSSAAPRNRAVRARSSSRARQIALVARTVRSPRTFSRTTSRVARRARRAQSSLSPRKPSRSSRSACAESHVLVCLGRRRFGCCLVGTRETKIVFPSKVQNAAQGFPNCRVIAACFF